MQFPWSSLVKACIIIIIIIDPGHKEEGPSFGDAAIHQWVGFQHPHSLTDP